VQNLDSYKGIALITHLHFHHGRVLASLLDVLGNKEHGTGQHKLIE